MNIAYLILAHHQPQHLERLLAKLEFEDTYFFIHVDRKSDISDFEKSIPKKTYIIILKDPIKVYRYDFSQVNATLTLLHAAINHKTNFQRYCLLSGADFPIKSNAYIKETLRTEKQFIRIDVKTGSQKIHLGHSTLPISFFRCILQVLLNIFPRRMYRKFDLYQGSQWWSLTHDCVVYILNFLENNPAYIRYLRFTNVPDEIFFHSIVKASPFRKDISHDFEREHSLEKYFKLNEHGCHYINWNATEMTLPKVLDISDLDQLLESKVLFARKFQESESSELLTKLEKIKLP